MLVDLHVCACLCVCDSPSGSDGWVFPNQLGSASEKTSILSRPIPKKEIQIPKFSRTAGPSLVTKQCRSGGSRFLYVHQAHGSLQRGLLYSEDGLEPDNLQFKLWFFLESWGSSGRPCLLRTSLPRGENRDKILRITKYGQAGCSLHNVIQLRSPANTWRVISSYLHKSTIWTSGSTHLAGLLWRWHEETKGGKRYHYFPG